MEDIKKTAGETLVKVIEVMKKRLEHTLALEDEDYELSAKRIKNDELIKLANFVMGILEKKPNEEAGEAEGQVRIVLDGEVKDWAK